MVTDVERLLREGADEIRSLRRQNEILAAKVETVELMAVFLHARPPEHRGIGMSEDVAWKMTREADKLAQEASRESGGS